MANPRFRDLRVWESENWRFFAGSPIGTVYGEPGWVCQDQLTGTLWVHGLGNDMVTWTAVPGGGVAAQAFATVNNAAGNTLVTPTAHLQTQDLTVTVADGRTSIAILDIADRVAGDILFLRLSSLIGGVTIEIRNATALGALLDTWLTAGGSGFFQFVFNGVAWELTTAQVPA